VLDLATISCDVFMPHVGSAFKVGVGGPPIATFTLTSAVDLPQWRRKSAPRSPFTLNLLGPPQPIVQQATYLFQHDVLGDMQLFVVPVGADANGVQYEIHFT